MSSNVLQKEVGHEYVDASEDLIAANMVSEFEAQVVRMYADKKMLRQIHTKMHGCVKAAFIIEDNLPPALKVGVFNKVGQYHAWVRFSNASTKPQPDKKKDIRGIAIKLLEVPGEKILNDEHSLTTQDFLLMSSETFFSKSIQEFSKTVTAFTSDSILKKILYLLNPLHWTLLMRLSATNIACDNPANIPYWSTQPYQFGEANRAVKYHLKPSPNNRIRVENTKEDNFLRVNLAQTLNSDEVNFDFYVQFQTDADTMPIEDPTVPWTSEYIKLATLKIYPQLFDSNKQLEFGDNLSFSPWHSLPEHRPLGGVNRVRKRVYEVMSKFRHKENRISMIEPEDSDQFLSNLFIDENKPTAKAVKTLEQKVPSTRILHTSATTTVNATRPIVYNYITNSKKLPLWLKKKGPVQGIQSVEQFDTIYSEVGNKRKVITGDDSTFIEELISINPYANYSYQISQFSNFFKYITDKAFGNIWFDTIDDKTRITWVYSFTYKNVFAALFLSLFMPLFLKKFLQNGLNNLKGIIEGDYKHPS